MNEAKNIWKLTGNISDIEEDLVAFFSNDGFSVEVTKEKPEKTTLIVINKLKLPKLFFRLKSPEIIKCVLCAEEPYATRLEYSYEYSRRFTGLAYSLLTVAIIILFGAQYVSFSFLKNDSVISACILVAFIGFILLMFTLYRIFINDHYMKLFFRLKAIGYNPEVVEKVSIPKYTWNTTVYSLSLIAILCVPHYFIHPSLSTIIYCTLGIGAIILFCLKSDQNQLTRSPHFIILLYSSILLMIYAITPVLVLCLSTVSALVVLFAMGVIFLLGLIVFKNTMLMFVDSINKVRSNDNEIVIGEKRPLSVTIAVLIIWLIVNGGCLIILLMCANLMEYCFLGQNYIFSNRGASKLFKDAATVLLPFTNTIHCGDYTLAFIRIFFVIYFFPLIFFIVYVVVNNIQQFITFMCIRARFGFMRESENIRKIVASISKECQIKRPYVRLVESDLINAYCIIPPIPLMRSIVVVTSAAQALPEEALTALIVHEMGHLNAGHSFVFAIMNFLSRWTFLGEGFGSVILKNSKEMEAEADIFALTWLENNTDIGRKALLDLFEMQEKQKIKIGLDTAMQEATYGLPAYKKIGMIEDIISEANSYRQKKWFDKRVFDLRLFTFFIFHGWFTTYLHVPYDERVTFIKNFDKAG